MGVWTCCIAVVVCGAQFAAVADGEAFPICCICWLSVWHLGWPTISMICTSIHIAKCMSFLVGLPLPDYVQWLVIRPLQYLRHQDSSTYCPHRSRIVVRRTPMTLLLLYIIEIFAKHKWFNLIFQRKSPESPPKQVINFERWRFSIKQDLPTTVLVPEVLIPVSCGVVEFIAARSKSNNIYVVYTKFTRSDHNDSAMEAEVCIFFIQTVEVARCGLSKRLRSILP